MTDFLPVWILEVQVAKGKSTPAVPSQLSSKNTISLASERNNVQAASSQASFSSSVTVERSGYDTVDDFSAVGEEGLFISLH